MSMRDYGFDEHGIVLNGLGCNTGKHPDFDEDILEELFECDVISGQSNFTGEAAPISDNGYPDWNFKDYFNYETLYYISIKKSPSLFSQAYKDMKELVDELVKSYREARKRDDRLPKLTRKEIRGMVRYISGSYNG